MKNPSHPGELVRDICGKDGLNVTITQAAEALGVNRTTLSRLINGKANVSAEMAMRLSKAFGSTTGFWLRLQLNYDIAQIEKRSSSIKVKRVAPPEERPSL
jgi:addiction module HigA family antidote